MFQAEIGQVTTAGSRILRDAAPRPLAVLRLGVTSDYVADDLDQTVSTAFNRAIGMSRRAGASVERFAFPELHDAAGRYPLAGLTAAQAWAWHRERVARDADAYDPRVLKRLRAGEGRSAADYIDLLAARERFARDARPRLVRFDAWLMPTVAVVPPAITQIESDDEAFFAMCSEAGLALSKVPKGQEFDRRYTARYKVPIDAYAPFAYDAVYVIYDAMKRANSTNREKILAAMPVTQYDGVIGKIAFDPRGDLKDAAITIYQFMDKNKTVMDVIRM
jgi:hypothetical protein